MKNEWLFELATRFHTPISDLADLFTVEEFEAWREYLSEPRGDARQDWHAAQVTKAISDIARAFGGGPSTSLEQFLLKFSRADQKSNKELGKALVALFGGNMSQKVKEKLVNLE